MASHRPTREHDSRYSMAEFLVSPTSVRRLRLPIMLEALFGSPSTSFSGSCGWTDVQPGAVL